MDRRCDSEIAWNKERKINGELATAIRLRDGKKKGLKQKLLQIESAMKNVSSCNVSDTHSAKSFFKISGFEANTHLLCFYEDDILSFF
jgi:hypothetical protein